MCLVRLRYALNREINSFAALAITILLSYHFVCDARFVLCVVRISFTSFVVRHFLLFIIIIDSFDAQYAIFHEQ